MKTLKLLLSATILGIFAGCSSVKVKDYKNENPPLVLEDFFSGTIDGYGMLESRGGKVKRRFHVVIQASTVNGVTTLDESFDWSDGEKQKRVWTITKKSDGKYEGKADDVIGKAEGEVAGNAINWKYTLAVPVDGSTYHFTMDDWMYLIDKKVLLNKTEMTKWGFRVGTLTISMTKR